MPINFKSSQRDEGKLLVDELNSHKLEVRIGAVKKVISAMTVGKDVSDLFPQVLKCVET
jgi:AP-1 complex subunit beta-1